MDCERYENLIADAALGSLDASRESGLGNHLASCARCRAEFERERRLFGAIDRKMVETLAVEPSPDFVARIRLNIAQAEIPPASLGSLWFGFTPRVWLAAACLGVLAVGISVWRIRRGSPVPQQAISAAVAKNVSPQPKVAPVPPAAARLAKLPRLAHTVTARQIKRTRRAPQVPQVLVEKDEAALVLNLYNAVRTGQVNGASLVTPPPGFKRDADGTLVPVPLKIEPIEIAALDPERAVAAASPPPVFTF